ncbi:mitogen-activated protein kinase kinase kinase 11-like [Symphalangus syndactylus]|uniref:mitogen-activated protein kinase kinase kinase 11-like n=1 Tax=Symphalangus syndactylus TaxID=9590 RepID=UPI00300748D4
MSLPPPQPLAAQSCRGWVTPPPISSPGFPHPRLASTWGAASSLRSPSRSRWPRPSPLSLRSASRSLGPAPRRSPFSGPAPHSPFFPRTPPVRLLAHPIFYRSCLLPQSRRCFLALWPLPSPVLSASLRAPSSPALIYPGSSNLQSAAV